MTQLSGAYDFEGVAKAADAVDVMVISLQRAVVDRARVLGLGQGIGEARLLVIARCNRSRKKATGPRQLELVVLCV